MVRDLSKLLGGVKLNGANIVSEPAPHPQYYIYIYTRRERGTIHVIDSL